MESDPRNAASLQKHSKNKLDILEESILMLTVGYPLMFGHNTGADLPVCSNLCSL